MATKTRIMCFAPGRVSPEMTLAKAVTDREGNTLLASGTVLEPEMLERLIRRGVEALSVLVPDTRDENAIAEELQAVSARIETIFRGPTSPAREELRAAVLNFRFDSTK